MIKRITIPKTIVLNSSKQASKSKKSSKFKSKKILKSFMDNSDVSLHGLQKCVKNIVIENYLGNGAFGSVHKIKYEGSYAAIKIIPISEDTDSKGKDNKHWKELNPNIRYTTTPNVFEGEIDMLKKLSKLNVCPKIKYHGFCMVDVHNKKTIRRLKVGYIVSELFNDTMWSYIRKDIVQLIRFINEQKFENTTAKNDNKNNDEIHKKNKNIELSIQKQLESYIEKYERIDEKLNEDLRIARKHEIYNNDSHFNNIMVKYDKKMNVTKIKIVDWGFSNTGNNFSGLEKINTKKVFIKELFGSLLRPFGPNSTLPEDIKKHLQKLDIIFEQINWSNRQWNC